MSDDAEQRLVRLVHDLRTPLTVVHGLRGAARAPRPTRLSAEQRDEYVARIAGAARELREILDAERTERLAES